MGRLDERLVQEPKIDGADVFIASAGKEKTAGDGIAGLDTASGDPGGEDRDGAALNGAIEVSVDIDDDELAGKVRNAFAEFSAQDVTEA